MNARSVAERLASNGLDESEIQAKADLFDRTLRAFDQICGAAPELALWVPGRLEVFGTHTDYAGGSTLVAALPRGFAFAAKGRTDGALHVADAVAGESVTFDTARPPTALRGWRHYIEVVVNRLTRNFPAASLGADITFASDLPRAAGMSSSSALIVGVASALVRLSGIRESDDWLHEVPGRLEEAGYYACIENGRSFGTLLGHEGVGTHGGSEDHAAMLCGTAKSVTSFSFAPMRQLARVTVPETWQFIIATSGVAAEKTGSARTLYNRLAQGTAALLEIWNGSETPSASLAAAISSSADATARLERHIRGSAIPGWPRESLSARLRHFIRENARIPLAISAFEAEDATAIGDLSSASQDDSETLLENQVAETKALPRLAHECGAFAARSFGAGFGGSVWALVERDRGSDRATEWLNLYREQFPSGRAMVFPAGPAPSVTEFHP